MFGEYERVEKKRNSLGCRGRNGSARGEYVRGEERKIANASPGTEGVKECGEGRENTQVEG